MVDSIISGTDVNAEEIETETGIGPDVIEGSRYWDRAYLGSGQQVFDGGAGGDRIISYADAGEPDPAQTDGAEGRVTEAIAEGAADDVLTGGAGGDTFEFRALLNARESTIAEHTNADGSVNWRAVAGENDNVHDHWVEGFGNDVITDYSKNEGDKIVIRGHTVEVAEITYGEDENGSFSLIRVISQQGDGGAAGANTATGAHDEDELGTIKVYGDQVTIDDITVQSAGVFDGVDQLARVDEAYGDADAGVTQEVFSNTDGTSYTGILASQTDRVRVGEGSQEVATGGGNDYIYSYSDGGEPDPAQTEGADGRVTDPVAAGASDDILTGGQGADTFSFNLLLNATEEVLEAHTRWNGTINWRGVAGENNNVHDHWVEGIGNDVITDYSKQDGDKILIRGHTVEIAEITYGTDEGGDYSLIQLRSQQGDNGGAHDEDLLGTIKVYGDTVTIDDITVQSAGVFDGVDAYADAPASASVGNLIYGDSGANTLVGTGAVDIVQGQSGADVVDGGDGDDFLFGGGHNDIIFGGAGGDWVEGGSGNDMLFGNDGDDTLVADSGVDQMFGGAGNDLFVFENGARGGSILDWEDGADLIDFSRIDAVSSVDDLTIEAVGGNFYEVSYTNDDGRLVEIQVIGGTDFGLDAGDFVF